MLKWELKLTNYMQRANIGPHLWELRIVILELEGGRNVFCVWGKRQCTGDTCLTRPRALGLVPNISIKKKKYLVERVISINTGKAGVSALAVLPERGISTIYNSNTLSGQCRQNILTHKNNVTLGEWTEEQNGVGTEWGQGVPPWTIKIMWSCEYWESDKKGYFWGPAGVKARMQFRQVLPQSQPTVAAISAYAHSRWHWSISCSRHLCALLVQLRQQL